MAAKLTVEYPWSEDQRKIAINDIRKIALSAIDEVGRQAVKNVISRYAPTLTAVPSEYLLQLYADLIKLRDNVG